jgi:diaminopropionate ammonia-lyase
MNTRKDAARQHLTVRKRGSSAPTVAKMHASFDRASGVFLNPHRSVYLPPDRELIARSHAEDVHRFLDLCPAYRATPLLPLADLATELDLGEVCLKAEWSRMGLSSFKALGGVYAVALLVAARAGTALGRSIRPDELCSAPIRAIANGITVTCASAGNHGLAVAAGARAFGARAVVWLSGTVSENFATALRGQGATVLRRRDVRGKHGPRPVARRAAALGAAVG